MDASSFLMTVPCLQQDRGTLEAPCCVPPFQHRRTPHKKNSVAPPMEGRHTESREEFHIPVSQRLSFPFWGGGGGGECFFSADRSWKNEKTFTLNSRINAESCQISNMRVDLAGTWQKGRAGELHLTFMAAFHHSCCVLGDPSHHTLHSMGLFFSVFATFTCVVCVTAARLSSCNLDLCVQFLTLNDGVCVCVCEVVLSLGSPDDSLVELK